MGVTQSTSLFLSLNVDACTFEQVPLDCSPSTYRALLSSNNLI
jgi:hypothetical protein